MTKLAVITGASRGLGLVVVKEFAHAGWHVVGMGRSERPAEFPTGAEYRQFDASNATACEDFWKSLAAEYPSAEICLVNNAGAYASGGLLETKPADYEQQMHGNYFTAVHMTRAMVANVPKARIINAISASALAAHKNNSAYGAAKAAEMHFFQSLQQELPAEKYQITNLYPSDIATREPNPAAMTAEDLAGFIRDQAESTTSFYLRDVTIYPRK